MFKPTLVVVDDEAMIRCEDIPLLVEYFIDLFNTEFRKRILGATPAAYGVLQAYG